MPPRAVLFDFDGVIVDTENVHIAAWQLTLARMGWELTDEAAAPAAEIDDRAFIAALFKARGIDDADLDGWLGLKRERVEAMLAESPRAYPGVVALVASLRGAARLGVVTTTRRRNVEIVLGALGLADAFEVVVAGDDVEATKPAPDGYRLALERLGVAPADAVAIEDSPAGVDAARAAGLRVVAVGHRRADGPWTGGLYRPDLADTAAVRDAMGF